MRLYSLFLFVLVVVHAAAQPLSVYSPQVKTLLWKQHGAYIAMPVYTLGSHEQLQLSFDLMEYSERELRYEIEHCSAIWQSSGLNASEYLEGLTHALYFARGTYSWNTDVRYTHYGLTLPNAEVGFRLSGNYKLHVYHEDSLLLTTCFAVVAPRAHIAAHVTTDTDRGRNGAYQQLEVEVNHTHVEQVRIARDELFVVVVPNGWWAKAVHAPAPSMVLPQRMKWTHHAQLVFDAGNEYRKFEILHTYNAYQGVDRIAWHVPYAHAYLYESEPRRHYLYDKDYNGGFVVRNEDNRANDTESHYMMVHFDLKVPHNLQGDYYIVGGFNQYQPTDDSRMQYDHATGSYKAQMQLKQGYYNYLYTYLPHGLAANAMTTAPIEGNFYQTENEYSIYLYHRRADLGCDLLVGYTTLHSTP